MIIFHLLVGYGSVEIVLTVPLCDLTERLGLNMFAKKKSLYTPKCIYSKFHAISAAPRSAVNLE